MNDIEEIPSVIFELGTHTFKIGISGMNSPYYSYYPYMGITKENMILHNKDEIDSYVNNSNNSGTDLTMIPMMNSNNNQSLNVELFDEFIENFISNNDLLPDIMQHPFVFSERAIHDKDTRMSLTNLMFETYAIPYLFICKDAVLSSFAFGRTTCLVVDMGHSATTITPINDGMTIKKAIIRDTQISGVNTNKMLEVFINKGDVTSLGELSVYDSTFRNYYANMIMYHDIKCKFNEAIESTNTDKTISYTLPDNEVITLDAMKFVNEVSKKMFNEDNNNNESGLSNLIFNSVVQVELDIKKELFCNLCLCGGNSILCDDIATQVQNNISKRVSLATVIKMTSHVKNERSNIAWLGASILTSLGTFIQWCVTKEDYEEQGAVIIERKCA